jgi:hypothetical protein
MGVAKRSAWFLPPITPVRSGWYECGVCGGGVRHYYKKGKGWVFKETEKSCPISTSFPWRGLTKKQKG